MAGRLSGAFPGRLGVPQPGTGRDAGALTLSAAGAAWQVRVRVRVLSHSTANTTAIFGRHGCADAGGAPMGGLTPFAENANTFDGELPTCIELRATAPVPEPGAWALMVGGLALLGGRLRRNA